MEAFATVEQLEAGWDVPPDFNEDVAAELLMRASAQLTSMLAQRGIAIDPTDEVQAKNLETATCNMVRHSMGSFAAEGIQSMQQTIGSTNASVTWSNPDGDFYICKNDRRALGLYASGQYRAVRAMTYVDQLGG